MAAVWSFWPELLLVSSSAISSSSASSSSTPAPVHEWESIKAAVGVHPSLPSSVREASRPLPTPRFRLPQRCKQMLMASATPVTAAAGSRRLSLARSSSASLRASAADSCGQARAMCLVRSFRSHRRRRRSSRSLGLSYAFAGVSIRFGGFGCGFQLGRVCRHGSHLILDVCNSCSSSFSVEWISTGVHVLAMHTLAPA